MTSGRANGDIKGFGAFGGIYGAKAFSQRSLILDYYVAGSIGHHSYDLTFANTVPTDIDADGSYTYGALFGGLSVSGERQYEAPRFGAHLRYPSAFDADVTASIPGYSESAKLSLADQSGIRCIGELGVAFGDADPLSEDERYTRTTIYTPGIYCDAAFGRDQDTVCGARIGLELVRKDEIKGTS